MSDSDQVARGPASRAASSAALLRGLADEYGIRGNFEDLGGSSNLNLLVEHGSLRFVVRVYRPWTTASRLADMQLVRRELARRDVPTTEPVETRRGETWIVVRDRLVEVEPYIQHDSKMDSWQRIKAALPLLGRAHTLMQALEVSQDGSIAPAANHVEAADVVAWTLRGTSRIRSWEASPAELRLADASDELAKLLDSAEKRRPPLARQLVHGDFWDNNVLFHGDRVVLVGDFDFMGVRPRIDDLALVLYYTNSTFWEDPLSDSRMRALRDLVDAYDDGLTDHLTAVERSALPLALARTPLCFVGMLASIDTPAGARRLAAEITPDVAWALAIARDLDRWQRAFA
ncbi:MAG TPA: phosphotransferase [Dehalococcoidia bacterium]